MKPRVFKQGSDWVMRCRSGCQADLFHPPLTYNDLPWPEGSAWAQAIRSAVTDFAWHQRINPEVPS